MRKRSYKKTRVAGAKQCRIHRPIMMLPWSRAFDLEIPPVELAKGLLDPGAAASGSGSDVLLRPRPTGESFPEIPRNHIKILDVELQLLVQE